MDECSEPKVKSLAKSLKILSCFTIQEPVLGVTELAERIGGGIKGNMLSRKLNKYHKELAQAGIAFSKSRSGERRELRLVYTSDDSNDGMTVADES